MRNFRRAALENAAGMHAKIQQRCRRAEGARWEGREYSVGFLSLISKKNYSVSDQLQVSASLIVVLLSNSNVFSAAIISSGTLLPTRSLFRTLDMSIMPFNHRLRDNCTYKLYGSH